MPQVILPAHKIHVALSGENLHNENERLKLLQRQLKHIATGKENGEG